MCKPWREYDKNRKVWINHACVRTANVANTSAQGIHTCLCRCGAVPKK